MLPQHLRRDGFAPVRIERVTHVRHVPRAIEGCIGQLVDQLEYRDLIEAGACLNVVVQKHNPRPPERS